MSLSVDSLRLRGLQLGLSLCAGLALVTSLAAADPLGSGSASDTTRPPITALAFAPDGQTLVAGSQAGVQLFSWPSLETLRSLPTSLVNIHDIAFAPDGRHLAVAGGSPAEAGAVELFAWPNGSLVGQAGDHSDSVLAVAWRDDQSFAMASLDHQVSLWQVDAAEPLRRLDGHSRGVAAVIFLPQSNLLVSGGLDQNIRVWDVDTGEMLRTLNNHTREVHQLAVRPASQGLAMLASVSNDGTVRLWQPTIGRMVRFRRLDSPPLSVDWLPDGSRLVVCCVDGHVRVIDPDSAEVLRDLPQLDGRAYAIAVHPSDGTLAVGGRFGQLQRVSLQQP